MKVIVGLGNPGKKYHLNRHNVGFMFLDYLIQDVAWQSSNKGQLDYFWTENNTEKIEYVKPITFMNESGKAVSYVVKKHPLSTMKLFIVHDDLDIKLGGYKIQFGKGPKLHNGIASIEKHLKTDAFWRVRIGVDNRDANNRVAGETYVLENFLHIELKKLNVIFKKIEKDIYNL